MISSRNFLVAILMVLSGSFFGQLTGVATLSNQSNHLGIKVKFISNSQTAVTDSVYTNSSGFYSININPGVYYVEMTKPGYQTVNYNNNVSLLLNNSTVLNSTTLIPGTSIVNVSGNVSGNWTSNYIYNVTGDLDIPYNQTLTIQPGTTVQVAGNYTIFAWGVLTAIGSDVDPIVFTSAKPSPSPGDWAGLNLYDASSTIIDCIVEYATRAILSSGGKIMSNDIRKFSYIGIMGGSIVKNNKVHDYLTVGNSSAGIMASHYSSVECNEVYNGIGYGIKISGSTYTPTLRHNIVHDITDPNSNLGFGITIEGSGGDAMVKENIIYNCRNGVVASTWNNTDPKSHVVNNVIYSNGKGILLGFGSDCCINTDIGNNIVVNNQYGIEQGAFPIGSSQIFNNCVWNNSIANYQNVNIVAIGQTVTTNSNGDPVDSYLNISKNPLFVNNIPPYLMPTSPCYNAGNSNYSPHIGFNANAICTNTDTGISEIQSDINFSLYPNPFSDNITVKISYENVSLTLKDILGKDIKANVVRISMDEVVFETAILSKGIYFLTLNNGSASKTVKLFKN